MPARMRRAFAAALCLVPSPPRRRARHNRTAPGEGCPSNKISIQEYTFAEYIGFGTDAAAQARLEQVLAFLRDTGYRNIELFTLSGLSAQQTARAAGRVRHQGLGAPRRRRHARGARRPGQDPRGEPGPGHQGLRVGVDPARPTRPRRSGSRTPSTSTRSASGPARPARPDGHNHNHEFESAFGGTMAYDILLAHTDPRNVESRSTCTGRRAASASRRAR